MSSPGQAQLLQLGADTSRDEGGGGGSGGAGSGGPGSVLPPDTACKGRGMLLGLFVCAVRIQVPRWSGYNPHN